MNVGPLLAALAKVKPELAPQLHVARSAHSAANALHAGRRYHTRSLRGSGHDGWKRQLRDERGRWTR